MEVWSGIYISLRCWSAWLCWVQLWGLFTAGYIDVLDERSLREGASLWAMISQFGLSNACTVRALHDSLDVQRDPSSIIEVSE